MLNRLKKGSKSIKKVLTLQKSIQKYSVRLKTPSVRGD